MNYYQARQRTTGRWDYTVMNNRLVSPVGYCQGRFDTIFPERRDPSWSWYLDDEHYAHERAKVLPFAAHYHDDGHATEDEANACYRRYQLDQRLRLDGGEGGHAYYRCQAPGGCTTLTNRYAELDHLSLFHLCDEHRTREVVEQLAGNRAGLSISSY